MPPKRKLKDNSQQLSLFDIVADEDEEIEPQDIDDESEEEIDPDNFTDEDIGIESGDRFVDLPQELLTLTLLREAIQTQNPDDPVMADFAEFVLPNLLHYAIGVSAKGGKFFEELDRRRIAAGQPLVRRDNAGDQSLNTHLLNGLFPANLIERRLQDLNITVRREVKELERRIALAAFILHDFEKFKYDLFPTMPEKYREIARDFDRDIRKLPQEEHREIFRILVPELQLDRFLFPDNPDRWLNYLDDLLYVAYNAQERNDTNLNLSSDGLQVTLKDRKLEALIDLTCLADRLASIVKHPEDARHKKLHEVLQRLSDSNLEFTYHSIAENRGVLTNVVNNAVMDAHKALNTDETTHYLPLLYLPTGVIYLRDRNAPPVSATSLPDRVVETLKTLCQGELRRRQTGFNRDGKGMKYAEYYTLFFDARGLMEVALEATLRILKPSKESVAKERSDNLVKFQRQQVLSADYNFSFESDIRIDQIAEFGDAIDRKIWGDFLEKIAGLRKNDKKLPPPPAIDILAEVAHHWQLEEFLPPLREIERINERLKALKLKGNTGGVPYGWYYLAAKYLERHPGIAPEEVRSICADIIELVAAKIEPILATYTLADGWADLKQWVGRVVMLPDTEVTTTAKEQADIFLKELQNYTTAKKSGRGRQLICSISHSAYTVSEQMESAVLFTPQVYTNKQMLGGSNAKRNISSIAGLEMMLRQILMNQTQAVGKKFEDGKYRYLYFYPTYYFTPETNTFLQKAYLNIAQTRFDTSIRNHFINERLEADFSRRTYQSIDSFLIDRDLERSEKKDLTFKLSYPEDKPLTFYFMALPPGRKPTDTESWVMPAWLAFAFPLILDVKTVVSESPIPPYRDGAEFEETVFLDGAPQALRHLTGRDRFRIDSIVEPWEDRDRRKYPAPLNVLTVAYSIHLDVNSKRTKTDYKANWGRLAELATHLATNPLYVFYYLSKWTRGKDTDLPSIRRIQLYTYEFYPCFDPYVRFNRLEETLITSEQSPMNHPKNLTDLYRAFYRANKRYSPKANAVLKPIDVAADTILKAELSIFSGQTLVAAVAAEVCKLMDRVRASTAEGRWVISDREEERQKVLEFARYFVTEVFEGAFKGDRARLAGRQLNLIRSTCEFLYRLEQDKENQREREAGKIKEAESEPQEEE